MGKRRIRCLQALGPHNIAGSDIRADRCREANGLYGIVAEQNVTDKMLEEADAVIISTPPHAHAECVARVISRSKPIFIEASVILDDVKQIQEHAQQAGVFVAPSCTLRFHPVIQEITQIISSGKYGAVSNFSYHSGQYLPDWHPWENIRDYYVSHKITGAAREIVPFELTWITDTFGFPDAIRGFFGKTVDLGVDIDDTYSCQMRFGSCIGAMTVDVTSRFATRTLIVNLESAQIRWNWEEAGFKVYEAETQRWIIYNQPQFEAASQYNKNIGEKMYKDEIAAFIQGIRQPSRYPNRLADDMRVLRLLEQIETDGKHAS